MNLWASKLAASHLQPAMACTVQNFAGRTRGTLANAQNCMHCNFDLGGAKFDCSARPQLSEVPEVGMLWPATE